MVNFFVNDIHVKNLYINDKQLDSLVDVNNDRVLYARTKTESNINYLGWTSGINSWQWYNAGTITVNTYCLSSLTVTLRPTIATGEASWWFRLLINSSVYENFRVSTTWNPVNHINYDPSDCDWTGKYSWDYSDRYVVDPWYGWYASMRPVTRTLSISGQLLNRTNPNGTVILYSNIMAAMRTGSPSGGPYQWPALYSKSYIKYEATYDYSLKS